MPKIPNFFAADEQVRPFKKPKTRPELFWLVLRERFLQLISLNVCSLIFYIPMACWFIFFHESLLTLIPCIMFAGLGNIGLARVVSKWARDEAAMLLPEFRDAVRANWKHGLLLGFLTALVPIIVNWYAELVAGGIKIGWVGAAAAVFTLFLLLFWLLSLRTMYVITVTYKLKFRHVVTNAWIMTLAHFLTSAGIGLLQLFIPLLLIAVTVFENAQLGMLFLSIYFLLFGQTFSWLLSASYANRLCEEFINQKAGLPTRIGLAEEEF